MKPKGWRPQPPPFSEYKKKVFEQVSLTGEYIYHIGENPQLRQPSLAVKHREIRSPEFQKKVDYLKSCLLKYREQTGMGRGITAVQVGIPERFAVLYMPEFEGSLLTVINPVITKTAKKQLVYPEICMSANPLIAPVVRPAWVEFDYYDEEGRLQVWTIKGTDKSGKIYNRVVQHEIDHMNGIINIDHVPSHTLLFEVDPGFYEHASFEEVS